MFAAVSLGLVVVAAYASANQTRAAASPPESVASTARFAIVSDYGQSSSTEADVANLIHGWNPEFIVTLGDNNYAYGDPSTIDQNIGQYYHDYIYPYVGNYGPGATYNKFFPTLGNHDWLTNGAAAYFNYFTLPGNERYYDFVQGPVHFFVVDSDFHEPDGITSASVQAQWLQGALAAATEPWKVVYLHHPPFSSGNHGSTPDLQWPFQQWGASIVLAGHDHSYERIVRNGFPYIVNGLGGNQIYQFNTPISGSVIRYNSDYGAQLVQADNYSINFRFISRTGSLVDNYTLSLPTPTATTIPAYTATSTSTPTALATSTATVVPTNTATNTPIATATPVPQNRVLLAHITWPGRGDQPDPLQQLAISLTLLSGSGQFTEYIGLTTDASGYFTVSVGSLVPSSYGWRAKGPAYLAVAGIVTLQNSDTTSLEAGVPRSGDVNNDNVVTLGDYTAFNRTFGTLVGDPDYDPNADYDGNGAVNLTDLNFLIPNYGQSGPTVPAP